MPRFQDWSYPRLLLYALALALGIGLVIGASTSGVAFGTYTHSWEGTSELRSEAQAVGVETIVVTDTTEYEDVEANGTVAIAIAAEGSYGPEDRARLNDFVRRGGTLVIADDIGQTNQLLQELGASTRIDGALLRDEREYYRSPALPVATETSNHPYVNDSDSFTLNYGTALEPNGAEVLVTSSEYAYLDTTSNGAFDENETLGPRPVMTTESVGQGELVVISDSSALINAMLERPGNRAFVSALFDAHDRVLIDQSRSDGLPPLAIALLALRESAVLQLALVAGLVGAIAFVDTRPGWIQGIGRRFGQSARPDRADPDLEASDLRAILTAQYPDWDSDRRERIIQTIMNGRKKGGDND
ncbi:hypothetical protein HAPAU_26870 [Halalkalicoccus paucihalophilus]|uniref:DUF4350 domain-containing protein n=1 Tax=Halalkalicoccus paucihalophilus TaxID=1008153 RepID=A0A151ABZ1_9EURY|nr:DUF4350 domain-containing protein [Halalkalicoccus paucihalophilus]KYH25104.1 hypothetical protein HAPAU_26870 [Halalkalicoccus paucihalophilus]